MPRWARLLVLAAACALVVATILLIPQIRETKRDTARRERREEARQQAAEIHRLRVEQRPRRGELRARSAPRIAAEVSSRISADARRRVAAGELPTPVRRTDCKLLPGGRPLLPFGCTAVTSVIPRGEASRGGLVGYPYRALVNPRSGRYAFCKTTGVPAEGFLTRRELPPLPAACGG